jgi:hypothetical protein
MSTREPSPKVTNLSWGRVEVKGVKEAYKDVKLFPGGSRVWNWKETGTDHSPGIQIADVQELLESGARIIVLARGVFGRLKVQQTTINYIEAQGAQVLVHKTPEAIQVYNELCETQPVGALIHSTC